MTEKTRVRSYIRKGRIVRSFDRKGKKKKKLILGSVAALGLAGLGGLALKKKLGSSIIKSTRASNLVPRAALPSKATNIPIANITASQAPILSATNALTGNAINTVQPTNLPKLLKRQKKPILSSNKAPEVVQPVTKSPVETSAPKILKRKKQPASERTNVVSSNKNNSNYQSSDEIENRIAERIPENYKSPSKDNPHNLSRAEQYSISRYTVDSYEEINGTLRGIRTNKQLNQNLQDEVNAIRSGLNKMPSTDSPVVYRSVKPSSSIKYKQQQELDDIYNSYEVGKDFTEPAFLSTSTEELAGFGGNLRYEIIPKKGSQGKSISKYSEVDSEDEVLFPPNTSFKVLDKFIKDNTKYIRIQEL